MRGEIICIGDELISGRVEEKNSRYIAARLWPLGLEILWVAILGDEPRAIGEALKHALARADFVIVSGGLGVTEDDVTAQAAAEVFDLPLTESRRMIKNLRAFWEARGEELSDEIRKLAWLPQGAQVLSSRCAGFKLLAPGDKPVYFLPGVPAEMRRLTDQKVVPELVELAGGTRAVATRELRVFGLDEAAIQARLKGAVRAVGEGVGMGYYPDFPEERIFISARAASRDRAEALVQRLEDEVLARLGEYVVATGGETLEEAVGKRLAHAGLTLALAESCTGGLVGHRITQVPGASDYFLRGLVVYSNQAKVELLGVSPDTLERHGAVSGACAREMALGAARSAGADLGLAITGIAGPGGGSPQKPVGTVCFALARGDEVQVLERRFSGERAEIKAQSASQALDMLRRHLEGHA